MWLVVAIGGYFLNALAAIIDKILLKKSIPNPRVYAFVISVLGILAFVLAPWGFSLVPARIILLSLITGGFFVFSLVLFFTALKKHEASRVVPLVGGIQPLGIFLLSFLFLGERLGQFQIIAFAFLVAGGILISHEYSGAKSSSKRWLWYAVFSGILFAAFYTMTKYIFTQVDFINGLLWPRLGSLVVALLLLFGKNTREDLFSIKKTARPASYGAFILGQVSGAFSFVLINYAISLASVTLVNALQGTQYAFVFIMALVLSFAFPKLLKEKLTSRVIIKKIAALSLIIAGIVFLNI